MIPTGESRVRELKDCEPTGLGHGWLAIRFLLRSSGSVLFVWRFLIDRFALPLQPQRRKS